jgi:hypothetical protein
MRDIVQTTAVAIGSSSRRVRQSGERVGVQGVGKEENFSFAANVRSLARKPRRRRRS